MRSQCYSNGTSNQEFTLRATAPPAVQNGKPIFASLNGALSDCKACSAALHCRRSCTAQRESDQRFPNLGSAYRVAMNERLARDMLIAM